MGRFLVRRRPAPGGRQEWAPPRARRSSPGCPSRAMMLVPAPGSGADTRRSTPLPVDEDVERADLIGHRLNLRRVGHVRVSGVTRGLGSARGRRVPAYTRLAPLRRASSTSACPIPRLAPVIRTVLPVAPVLWCLIGGRSAGQSSRRRQDAGMVGVDELPGHGRVRGVGGHRDKGPAEFRAQFFQRSEIAGYPPGSPSARREPPISGPPPPRSGPSIR